jgi:tetratricopeptide (TPR) repeat protein
MLMLDWRPMSQAIEARQDMLPFAELAIEAAGKTDDPALRAEAYRDAASNFARTDQPDRARTFFALAATVYRDSGDRLGLSGVYRSMAVTVPMDADERIRLLTESVAVAREADDQPTLALALHSLGLANLWDRRYEEALANVEAADAVAAEAENLEYLRPHLASARARALARLGRLAEAAREAEQALTVFRRDGAAHAELRLLHIQGDVLTALGSRREAAAAWRRYLELAAGPGHIRETNALDDNDPDGAATIARITTQLTVLDDEGRG